MSQLNVDKVVSLTGGAGTAEFQLEASGNFNFDSGTLYVDSTNNRIGINDASLVYLRYCRYRCYQSSYRNYCQRPGAPVEGLFRYNSTDRTFEGYSYDQDAGAVQWGPIAGAGGGGIPDQSTNRYSASYTVGALLRSDGTNAYWSFDGENDTGWSTAKIWTHGYVGGGYQKWFAMEIT